MTFDAAARSFDETMARSRGRAEALARTLDDLVADAARPRSAQAAWRHRQGLLTALVEDLGPPAGA